MASSSDRPASPGGVLGSDDEGEEDDIDLVPASESEVEPHSGEEVDLIQSLPAAASSEGRPVRPLAAEQSCHLT